MINRIIFVHCIQTKNYIGANPRMNSVCNANLFLFLCVDFVFKKNTAYYHDSDSVEQQKHDNANINYNEINDDKPTSDDEIGGVRIKLMKNDNKRSCNLHNGGDNANIGISFNANDDGDRDSSLNLDSNDDNNSDRHLDSDYGKIGINDNNSDRHLDSDYDKIGINNNKNENSLNCIADNNNKDKNSLNAIDNNKNKNSLNGINNNKNKNSLNGIDNNTKNKKKERYNKMKNEDEAKSPPNSYKRWTESAITAVKEEYRNGKSVKKIAQQYGRSEFAIKNILRITPQSMYVYQRYKLK